MLPEDNAHKAYEDRSVKQDHIQHCKQCESECVLDSKAKLWGNKFDGGGTGSFFTSFF